MKELMKNAYVRLAGRAIAAGIMTAIVMVQATEPGDSIAWRSIAVAGGLAALEVFTPLNKLVGLFKAPIAEAQ